jgi:hypothetical protein
MWNVSINIHGKPTSSVNVNFFEIIIKYAEMRQFIAKKMQFLTNGLVFDEKTSGATKSRKLLEQVRFSLFFFNSLHDYSCIVGGDMNYRLLLLFHTLTHLGCDLINNLSTDRNLWPLPAGYILHRLSSQVFWAESLTIDWYNRLFRDLGMVTVPFSKNTNRHKTRKRYCLAFLCQSLIYSIKHIVLVTKYLLPCLFNNLWVVLGNMSNPPHIFKMTKSSTANSKKAAVVQVVEPVVGKKNRKGRGAKAAKAALNLESEPGPGDPKTAVDDLMDELDGNAKPNPNPDSDASSSDSDSDASESESDDEAMPEFPICYLNAAGRVRLENFPAEKIRSLFRRILRFIPADYSDDEVVILGFVSTRIESFHHSLRELVIGLLEEGEPFPFVRHQVTKVLRTLLVDGADASVIMARARPWVRAAMEKAILWSGDPSLWVNTTRPAEFEVQALEGDYFRFGEGFVKFFFTSEVLSELVNRRVSTGNNADLRGDIGQLRCGVKLEVRTSGKLVPYDQSILVILLLASIRASALQHVSLMYKMQRIQQVIDRAASNAPVDSPSKDRLTKCNRWLLVNTANETQGDLILRLCPPIFRPQLEDLQYLALGEEIDFTFGIFLVGFDAALQTDGPGYLTHGNMWDSGRLSMEQCKGVLAAGTYWALDTRGNMWKVSQPDGLALLNHLTSMTDDSIENLTCQVHELITSLAPKELMGEKERLPKLGWEEDWEASHLSLNNFYDQWVADPPGMIGHLNIALERQGVIMTAEDINEQLSASQINLRTIIINMNQPCHAVIIRLPYRVTRGLSRTRGAAGQGFVSYHSAEGTTAGGGVLNPVVINMEFLKLRLGESVATAFFLGTIRGAEPNDSSVNVVKAIARRLLDSYVCHEVDLVTLSIQHPGFAGSPPYYEAVLGMVFGDPERHGSMLGILAGRKRVISYLGFALEFSAVFDVSGTRRVSVSHLIHSVWYVRISPSKEELSCALVKELVLQITGVNHLYLFPKRTSTAAQRKAGKWSTDWIACVADEVGAKQMVNRSPRECTITQSRANPFFGTFASPTQVLDVGKLLQYTHFSPEFVIVELEVKAKVKAPPSLGNGVASSQQMVPFKAGGNTKGPYGASMSVRQVTDLINRMTEYSDQPSGKKGKFTGMAGGSTYCILNPLLIRASWEESLVVNLNDLVKYANYVPTSPFVILTPKVVCLFVWNAKPMRLSIPQFSNLNILKKNFS